MWLRLSRKRNFQFSGRKNSGFRGILKIFLTFVLIIIKIPTFMGQYPLSVVRL